MNNDNLLTERKILRKNIMFYEQMLAQSRIRLGIIDQRLKGEEWKAKNLNS